jgi:hypothetical protein
LETRLETFEKQEPWLAHSLRSVRNGGVKKWLILLEG